MIDHADVCYKFARKSVKLSKFTAIVGPVRTGKTAFVEGVEAALTSGFTERRMLWEHANTKTKRCSVQLFGGGRVQASLSFVRTPRSTADRDHRIDPGAMVVIKPPVLGSASHIVREELVARFASAPDPLTFDQATRDVMKALKIKLPESVDSKNLADLSNKLRSKGRTLATEINRHTSVIDKGATSAPRETLHDLRIRLSEAEIWEKTSQTRADLVKALAERDELTAEEERLSKALKTAQEAGARKDAKALAARQDRRRWLLKLLHAKDAARGGEDWAPLGAKVSLLVVCPDPQAVASMLAERIGNGDEELATMKAAPAQMRRLKTNLGEVEHQLAASKRICAALEAEVERLTDNRVYKGASAAELRAKIGRLEAAQSDEAALNHAKKLRKNAEMALEVVRSVQGIVKARLEEMQRNLREEAETKLAKYLPEGYKPQFLVHGNSIEVGLKGADDEPHSGEHLSGAEHRALQTALMMVWAEDVPPERRLVLHDDDHFKGLSKAAERTYLETLAGLVENGEIAQVIVTRHDDRDDVVRALDGIECVLIQESPDYAVVEDGPGAFEDDEDDDAAETSNPKRDHAPDAAVDDSDDEFDDWDD